MRLIDIIIGTVMLTLVAALLLAGWDKVQSTLSKPYLEPLMWDIPPSVFVDRD